LAVSRKDLTPPALVQTVLKEGAGRTEGKNLTGNGHIGVSGREASRRRGRLAAGDCLRRRGRDRRGAPGAWDKERASEDDTVGCLSQPAYPTRRPSQGRSPAMPGEGRRAVPADRRGVRYLADKRPRVRQQAHEAMASTYGDYRARRCADGRRSIRPAAGCGGRLLPVGRQAGCATNGFIPRRHPGRRSPGPTVPAGGIR